MKDDYVKVYNLTAFKAMCVVSIISLSMWIPVIYGFSEVGWIFAPTALVFNIFCVCSFIRYYRNYTLVSDKEVKLYVNGKNVKNIPMEKVQRVVLFFVKRWNGVDVERSIVFDDGTFDSFEDAYTLVHKSEEYSWIMIGYNRETVDKLTNRFTNLKFVECWSEYTQNIDF